jgi:hypothetical protein
VDEARIRGEGGPERPQLVIPLTIGMPPRVAGQTLAITELRALLYTQQHTPPTALACQPVSVGLTKGFVAWSMSNGTTGSNPVELRFFPSASDIELLERHRHAAPTGPFNLFLKLDPVVAGLQNFNEQQPGRETVVGPWDDPRLGMYAELYVFWTSTIDTVPLAIEHTTWIERVLPGLGYDQRRLLEVSLPPPLPNHGSAASEFDKAKRALAERRYADCVAACRGLIVIWEHALGSTRDRRVASVVAERLGWESTDLRRRFVDDLWKAANDISNVPHHPEGQPSSPQAVDARDARLLLFLVTGLSEYLGSLPA